MLRDAGLVRVRVDGNQRLYRVDTERLAEVRAALEGFWGARLGRLSAAIATDREHRKRGADGERPGPAHHKMRSPASRWFSAPPEEVFRWFVRPELLVRWLGINAQLEPRPGGRFRFEITDGRWCSGRYLELIPARRVVVTWGWDSGAIPVPPGSSTVSVDLLEHPEGTLVRLVHRDLAPEVRQLHAEGWSRFLPRLAAVVAGRDPGADPAASGLPPSLQP